MMEIHNSAVDVAYGALSKSVCVVTLREERVACREGERSGGRGGPGCARVGEVYTLAGGSPDNRYSRQHPLCGLAAGGGRGLGIGAAFH
jgi:hypothetical protein